MLPLIASHCEQHNARVKSGSIAAAGQDGNHVDAVTVLPGTGQAAHSMEASAPTKRPE